MANTIHASLNTCRLHTRLATRHKNGNGETLVRTGCQTDCKTGTDIVDTVERLKHNVAIFVPRFQYINSIVEENHRHPALSASQLISWLMVHTNFHATSLERFKTAITEIYIYVLTEFLVPNYTTQSLPNYTTQFLPNNATLFLPNDTTLFQPNYATLFLPNDATLCLPNYATLFSIGVASRRCPPHNFPAISTKQIPFFMTSNRQNVGISVNKRNWLKILQRGKTWFANHNSNVKAHSRIANVECTNIRITRHYDPNTCI